MTKIKDEMKTRLEGCDHIEQHKVKCSFGLVHCLNCIWELSGKETLKKVGGDVMNIVNDEGNWCVPASIQSQPYECMEFVKKHIRELLKERLGLK